MAETPSAPQKWTAVKLSRDGSASLSRSVVMSREQGTPFLAGKRSSNTHVAVDVSDVLSNSTSPDEQQTASSPSFALVPPPSLPPLESTASLKVAPHSHRRSRSAGSMKTIMGEFSSSQFLQQQQLQFQVQQQQQTRYSGATSPPNAELRGSKKDLGGVVTPKLKLRKQQSTVGKFFTAARSSGAAMRSAVDSAELEGSSSVEIELQIVLGEGKKVLSVRACESWTVREVLEAFLGRCSSVKLRKFLAARNVLTNEALGLLVRVEGAPVVWLRSATCIGRYFSEDFAAQQLVCDVLPLGGLPSNQTTMCLMMEDGNDVRLVDLDETKLIKDEASRCASILGLERPDRWYLFCCSVGKHSDGFWLDPAHTLLHFGLQCGTRLELREPNLVVLATINGERIVVDGLSTGESFLRKQLQRLKVPGNSSCYYSLFKETQEGELVELPTWQTFAKIGLLEKQLVHFGKVEDADLQPVSMTAFCVVSLELRGMETMEEDLESGQQQPQQQQQQQLQQQQQQSTQSLQQQKDWHSVLKLYDHEDILGKVEGAELVSNGALGVLCITNAGLVFRSDKTHLRVFHGMIAKTSESKRRKKGGTTFQADVVLLIDCKDYESISLVLPKPTPKNFLETLQMLAFPRETRQLYAFSYQLPPSVVPDPNMKDGWKYYDPQQFHERMGVGLPGSEWALSDINGGYTLCDTYPAVLAFPVRCSQESLRSSASFRSRGRLPALSYVHRNGASITRCSQPKVGLIGGSSGGDQILLQAILDANPNKEQPVLRLIDARPKLNAIANQAMGKGSERVFSYVFECTLEFANIDNIHVMRQSLVKLHEACRGSKSGELDMSAWQNSLASSGWLAHLHKVLAAGIKVARYVTIDKQSVVLHCSDGWDRTAQLSSLGMMLLNPWFRTIRGFCELIEKEWLAFGHQFARRHGHASGKMDQDGDSQRSPVFLQFLDCTWQLANIYPVAFEFTGFFLITVMEEVFNCRFGTFLGDCERERTEFKGQTVSLWTYILSPSVVDLYRNPLYKASPDSLLNEVAPHLVQLWHEYHCHAGRTRDDHDRARELAMRIETLEALLKKNKK